jgi:nucleotide-binding universal stress UspA family protein
MYTTIVVGTDGSPQALAAVRRAGEVASASGIDSVHVVAACHAYSQAEVERIEADLPSEFHDLINVHMRAIDRFDEARGELRRFGVDVVEHEASVGPARAILDVAEEVDADLVVVGARGLGAIERFVRGSVSTRVAHHSPCDVLIVEHDD